jgi:hypothetical protein
VFLTCEKEWLIFLCYDSVVLWVSILLMVNDEGPVLFFGYTGFGDCEILRGFGNDMIAVIRGIEILNM